MTFVVFAILAVLVRASLADRGNVALELSGGARMNVVKAHRAQQLFEIKDQLRQLTERVDQLEAEQKDEAAEGQTANTTAQTNCPNCRTRKFRLYLAETGAALTVGAVGVIGPPVVGAVAAGGTAAVTSGMLVKYATHLAKKYPCLKEQAQQQQMLEDFKNGVLSEVAARAQAQAQREVSSAQVEVKDEDNECLGAK
mmetsp:Transcript_23001/g.65402  ORF Transcript_23001/g.65402 Transcript_23001/m.65402 type:complete len:197 (-) Transcript_23001:102-692(-)